VDKIDNVVVFDIRLIDFHLELIVQNEFKDPLWDILIDN